MALPGETVSTGAPLPYPDAKPSVNMSGAGYFIGYTDEEGLPYSRESGYYASYQEAAEALVNDTYTRR